jgi:deazaflavin-dependent oxidoreductase (nitroreductase family)
MTRKRRVTKALWKVMNPLARPLSGVAPWWVLLETTGRRSGRPRHTPLARGAEFDGAHWIIAVHGEASDFVRNLKADPRVRFKVRRRWHAGTARVEPITEERLRHFGAYAHGGLKTVAIEPCLVRIELDR